MGDELRRGSSHASLLIAQLSSLLGWRVRIPTLQGVGVRQNKARFLKVKMIHKVPGLFAPVENVYHASQVLSWIASQQGTIESQLTRLGQIHGLMDDLLNQEKLPILRLGREYKRSR